MDFIEDVLSRRDWQNHVPSLSKSSPQERFGGWQSGREYLRLDGASQAVDRGKMVEEFNEVNENLQLFLISLKAGGLGINLCSASRVSPEVLSSLSLCLCTDFCHVGCFV